MIKMEEERRYEASELTITSKGDKIKEILNTKSIRDESANNNSTHF